MQIGAGARERITLILVNVQEHVPNENADLFLREMDNVTLSF